jgi:hypothetical protein
LSILAIAPSDKRTEFTRAGPREPLKPHHVTDDLRKIRERLLDELILHAANTSGSGPFFYYPVVRRTV